MLSYRQPKCQQGSPAQLLASSLSLWLPEQAEPELLLLLLRRQHTWWPALLPVAANGLQHLHLAEVVGLMQCRQSCMQPAALASPAGPCQGPQRDRGQRS